MQELQKIGFHESTLVGIRRNDGNMRFELEGVRVGSERRNASISLVNIQSITQDGITVEDLPSELEDSEVLTLECTERSLRLISEHTNFKTHRNSTHSYMFHCMSVKIEIH